MATSDVQLSLLKSKIAELKAQIKGERSIDVTTTGSLGVSCFVNPQIFVYASLCHCMDIML